MPNHCSNLWEVKGDDTDALIAFKEQAQGATEDFDINRFIPMPEELEHKNLQYPDPDPELTAAMVKKYGSDSNYNWAVDNWGTKWGAFRCDRRIGDDSITYEFKTAWGPFTESVMKTISAAFPTLTFTISYAEIGFDFWAIWEAQGGELRFINGGSLDSEWDEETETSSYPDHIPDSICALAETSG